MGVKICFWQPEPPFRTQTPPRVKGKFFTFFIAALCLVALPTAHAEPVAILHIRAHTRLDLHLVRRVRVNESLGGDDGIRLEGVLVDEPLGRPVAGRTVALAIEGEGDAGRFYRYAEPTAADGSFRFTAPLKLGRYSLRLASSGDAQYAAATAIVRRLDLGRSTPSLTIQAAQIWPVQEAVFPVAVSATEEPPIDFPESAGRGASIDLPLSLLVDGRVIATGQTHDGTWSPAVDAARLGAPGHTAELSVRFAGDAIRNPAEASTPVLVVTQTVIHAEGHSEPGQSWVQGNVSDTLGATPGAEITVATEDAEDEPGAPERLLGRTTSRSDGTFALPLPGLSNGRHALRVRVTPAERWRLPSSQSLSLLVVPVRVGRLPYFIPAFLTLFALASVTLARRRTTSDEAAPLGAGRRAGSDPLWSSQSVPSTKRIDLSEGVVRARAFDLYVEVANKLGADPQRRTPRELLADVQRRSLLPGRFARFVAAVEQLSWGRSRPVEDLTHLAQLAQLADEATAPPPVEPLDPGDVRSL